MLQTSEPDILPFRMRLGELRLDMGLYPEAASDFQATMARDLPVLLAVTLVISVCAIAAAAVSDASSLDRRGAPA